MTSAEGRSDTSTYTTAGGLEVTRQRQAIDAHAAIEELIDVLDTRRGVLLSSNYDYPGRYTRWDLGLQNPLLEITSRDRRLDVHALNDRGQLLLAPIGKMLEALDEVEDFRTSAHGLELTIATPARRFAEEERSRQPSVFSAIRALVRLFSSSRDDQLGLYGAFGYDLTFQFEAIRLKHARPADQRDMVLYLPEELLVVDRQKETAYRYRYDFRVGSESTAAADATPYPEPAAPEVGAGRFGSDHAPGEYADAVRRAKQLFKQGDLFELVLGQTFREPCQRKPSEIFRWLLEHNPAPYALLLNLGRSEHLIGASPEMYVRVEGSRVETCPISGTIARGQDPIEDAARIRELLNSEKDESELSMCTDVDRNDKSRICEPGSVRVIGRRQIELYSRLIHTVDHVEGTLRPGFDALDAFLTHTWAVTVTGAPKLAAIQRVEDEEKSPRAWYGGAIGRIGFDGNLNTGLTLRTVRLKQGVAEVRAGATLLYDSDPELEERETRVKASAFLDAIKGRLTGSARLSGLGQPGTNKRVLLVDHEDSFVHTLANYFRQTGATVVTLRRDLALAQLAEEKPDLVVLSPGPGTPSDFQLATTIARSIERGVPLFGVCLGLQGIGEYFGGKLSVLGYPMHGKPSRISVLGGRSFEGLPRQFVAGRYHSLFIEREGLPEELVVTAVTDDGLIMGLEHRTLPISAVQFHPESILTLDGDTGLRLVNRVVTMLGSARVGTES
ncbi:MAG TPA: anthranilate synthase component I [Polyangiaceae bacterium]|nr:anthranilate synthase component I [Polyangiaceae bacterium]